MTEINIQTGTSVPDLVWTPTNAVTECGQHTVVVSDSPAGGEVDLCYRTSAGIVLTGGEKLVSIPVALSSGDIAFDIVNVADEQVARFAAWAGESGVQVLTGNFTGQGRTDIALTGVAGWESIPVALSNGDGTFRVTNRASRFAGWASSAGAKVLTGDFTGDGRTDMALTGATEFPSSLPVVFSNGDGTFTIANQGEGDFAAWAHEPNVTVLGGDFYGDGRTGIALTGVAGWASIPVALFNATGDGTFSVVNATDLQVAAFAGWAAEPGVQVLTGDFTGDGRTDIGLTGEPGWASIAVALSNGDGPFRVVNVKGAQFAGWAAEPGVTARIEVSLPLPTPPSAAPPTPPQQTTIVPDVTGMQYSDSGQPTDAARTLYNSQLASEPITPPGDPEANLVYSQDPRAGVSRDVWTTVTCTLTGGHTP